MAKGSGTTGSKEEDDKGSKKPLIVRPPPLKDTSQVRSQVEKNHYAIRDQVENALLEGKITEAERKALIDILNPTLGFFDSDVRPTLELYNNQNATMKALTEMLSKKGSGLKKVRFEKGSQEAKDYMASIRAKRGSGMGSCSGGSAVSNNPSGPSGPPPPRPPRPSLPPPIDTSFSINQTLINDIEEILMSSSLPQERRMVLVAELRKLKEKVNDAGVAKASTAKPSGAGMRGRGSKSAKIAPAIPTASVELVGPPMASSRVIPMGEEDDGVPFVPDDLNFQEVTEREYPKVQETIDERYLFYRPKVDKQISMIEGQIDTLQKGIKRIDNEISFNKKYSFGGEDTYGESDFIYQKKQLSILYMKEIEKLKKHLREVENNAMFLNPENRELLGYSPSEFSYYRDAYFPTQTITNTLIRPSTKLEKAKSILFKPTIARIDDIANELLPYKPDREPMFDPNDIGRREAERVLEEERRREMAEMRTMGGYDKDVGGSGMKKKKQKN
jgi:hypothetical protein